MYDDNQYDDYGYVKQNVNRSFSFKNINLKRKLLITGIVLIIIIVIIVIINSVFSYYDSYEYFENKMIEKAQKYVKSNNLIINDEIYLDVSKLNIEPKETCNELSGVFVTKDYNYNAYLSCENYETNVLKNNTNKFSLKGREVTLLAKGIPYIEHGISGNKEYRVQGSVGTEEGIYNLTYLIIDNNAIVETLKRKVIIVDNIYVKSLFPTFTLNGKKVEYVEKGYDYVDKGVVAGDPVDLDITKKVRKEGRVDTNTPGEYDIIYTVTNSRGYTNSITRKVVVVNNFSTTVITAMLSTTNPTNQDVIINLNVIGNNYSYMILPDGSQTYSKEITYKVKENGTYNFFSYDNDNKPITKIVTVNNIDKTKPNAVCMAQVYNNYVDIYVTPYSGKQISGYNYMVNNISSGEIVSTSYKSNITNVKSVSVVIKDTVGNRSTVNCEITENLKDDMEIVPIPSESFRCNTDVTYYNAQLATRVNQAGIKTRDGVVAAANYLATELGYKIEYWWAGKYAQVGLNSQWGCNREIWATDGSGKYAQGNVLPYGMDCTGFVKWAFVNGGFDASLIPRSDMQQNFGNAKPIKVSFEANSSLINKLKKGDLLYSPGHIALVVGVDDTRIKLAQLTPAGLKVDLIDKFSGKALTETKGFTGYILLDEFYQMYGN